MKRSIISIIAVLLIFFTAYNFSSSQNAIEAPKNDIHTEISIKHISIGNNSYIHIRELFEKLNFSVRWIDSERAVLMHDENNFIKLHLDDDYFIFNGELIKHKIKPVINENKFYVDMSFLNSVFTEFEYDNSKNLLVFKAPEIFKSSDNLPAVENKEKLDKLLTYSNQLFTDKVLYGSPGSISTEALEYKDSGVKLKQDVSYDTKPKESDYSETNTQVKDVDEGDIVKTDGSFIYTLSNNILYIVKSSREDFGVVNKLKFDNYDPIEFYIKDNRLITIGYFHGLELNKMKDTIDYKIYPRFSNPLKVHVYDIKNKNQISLIRNIEVDGRYLSSRLIDNNFYLVANKRVFYNDHEVRPYYKDSIDNKKSFIDYKSIRYFPESIYNNYLITLGVDLNNLDSSKIDVNAYLGSGNNMYVSKENMYISEDKYKYNIYALDEKFNNDVTSSIFKFKLEDGRIIYSTKGEVPGKILNQFSMDEHNGNFRIATTKGESPWGNESKSTSNVYVLDENLKLLGSTKDLAPGERIYSVRFMGDKVYVVTFRQVDPFYVIDLKEPNNPKVLGYLKIPGYSSYLHPYDENHIIGIGMDTSDVNGRVTNEGVKIAMFDVTDYSNPIELDKVIIGEKGSHTDILHDHKALLFSKEKNILSFPVYASSYDKATYKHTFETQAAFVFSINKNYKFNLRGNISHLDGEKDYSKYIRRIIFIDNNLYTISDTKIKLSDFDTLKSVKDLSLEGAD